MAVTSTPVLPQAPKCAQVLTNATSKVTIYTGGANGTKIFALIAQSTDGTARDVQLYITTGGVDYAIGTVPVPAGSGNSGTVPSVNMFNTSQIPGLPTDSDGNTFIFLSSASFALKAAALTSSSLITLTAMLADF